VEERKRGREGGGVERGYIGGVVGRGKRCGMEKLKGGGRDRGRYQTTWGGIGPRGGREEGGGKGGRKEREGRKGFGYTLGGGVLKIAMETDVLRET